MLLRISAAAGALAALVITLGGCAAPRGAPAASNVPYEIVEWTYRESPGYEVRTPHYEVYTTLRDRQLVNALPQAMETAHAFYRSLVPAAREPDERMKVYLFASRPQFVDFTKRFAGIRAAVLTKVRGGGYSERGVSVIEYAAHEIAFPVFAHEGMHQYLHHCVRVGVPAWLNEGLAVLCEGQRWNSKGLAEIDPRFNPLRRNALAEVLLRNRQFPLPKLLSMNAGHVVGGESSDVDAFYGQVWALMLFLQEGEAGKYASGFKRMLAALGAGDLETYAQAAHAASRRSEYHFGQALFAAFIADDLDAVDREYQKFMRERILQGK